MTQPDLNNLRSLLDEYERYASSIAGAAGRRAAIAKEMLGAIAEARLSLHPSPDSTANYVEAKAIIERLDGLRKRSGQAA